jgi:hypothetical protein
MAELPFVTGARKGLELIDKRPGQRVTVFGPKFKQELQKEGITLRETPQQFLGAYTTRLLTDVVTDGTRAMWWAYNHPNALADKAANMAIGKQASKEMGVLGKGLVMSAAVAPAIAASGAYDITNIGEVFRPKGFAQTYAEEGSEDRRETQQPVQEAFERFFLGRTGRPLAYEEAKKDIPDLTPERYGNFLRSYYQDRGLMGVLKATPENLQGVPEARLLGYPVTIPSVLGVAGGAAAAGAVSRMGAATRRGRVVRAASAGLAGSLGGILTGNVINEVIAAGNRPKLPTVNEYESLSTDRIVS